MKIVSQGRVVSWKFETKRVEKGKFTILFFRESWKSTKQIMFKIENGKETIAQWSVNFEDGKTFKVVQACESDAMRDEMELYLKYEITTCLLYMIELEYMRPIRNNFHVPGRCDR